MSGILNAVFGAGVLWTPDGGSATEIRAVFREIPVRVPSEDGGETLVVSPTVEIPRPAADAVARGDVITPGNGNSYSVIARHPKGSPAGDAFVLFELEKIA